MQSASNLRASGEILMPRILKPFPVAFDKFPDFVEPPGREAVILGQGNLRGKPELGFIPVLEHMDVRRFPRGAFVGVEQEPQTVDA